MLLIAALAYAQIGFFLRYECLRVATQRAIKNRIRQGLPLEQLTPFRMSEQEWRALEWVKPEREFRLADGAMFDVVRVGVKDGEVHALCIADHAETGLFEGLKEHVRRQLEGGDPEHGPSAQVHRLFAGLQPPREEASARISAADRSLRAHPSRVGRLLGHRSTWLPPPKA